MSIQRIGGVKTGTGGQNLPFSQGVIAGDFFYMSGQVAMDENGEIVNGGIVAQTEKTMEHIIRILKLVDLTLDDVVKVGVWLDDPRDFASFNRVYAKYFTAAPPARSTVESRIMVDAKIEMDVVAYKKGLGDKKFT